jgi:type IV secretory pathway VirB2 component (pilin)
MATTVTLEWKPFINGEIVRKGGGHKTNTVAKAAGIVHVLFLPRAVFAAAADGGSATWAEIFETVLNISDWLCVGIIIYAGATWMFGNRTKAIEHLLGGAIGYIIIRHAEDIRDWLRSL